jgi:hypothetical protein
VENDAAPAHVVGGKADQTAGSRFPTVPGDGYKAPVLVKGSRRGETLMQYTEQYPYPKTTHITIGGKDYLYIDSDSPAEGDPKYANKWKFGGLPTIAKFGRMLILIGVVVATIFTAIAAYGMVMGEENAGSRVVFSVAGLMLLLMSFTIWKVVQANMANLNDNGPWDAGIHKLPPRILLPDTVPEKIPPKTEDSPPRSGIPVYPDSGH